MGGNASTAIGPETWTGTVLPFLIDAARQGAKLVHASWPFRRTFIQEAKDSAISALELKGACLERNWPFDIDKVNNRPVEPCFNEALRYKIAESEKVPVDLSSMRRCLAEGHPIVFGLKLTAQFFKPAAGGGISTPDPDDPQSSEHGLHAMLIVGYSDRQEVFIVRNSWGTSWGDGGYGYVPYDYICNDDFNFLGQYAIMGLTEMDFTPDQDDGQNYNFTQNEDDDYDLDEYEDDPEDDEEDDFDVEDEFDPKNEAERAFRQFDANGDGTIDGGELMTCFLMNGIRMNPIKLAQICASMDVDKDGKFNFEEFWHLMQAVKGSATGRMCG